jgi:hypothetical protein
MYHIASALGLGIVAIEGIDAVNLRATQFHYFTAQLRHGRSGLSLLKDGNDDCR